MNTYHLAVMGNPIRQSQSPVIHKMFAEEFNLSISYKRVLVPDGGFDRTVSEFIKNKVLICMSHQGVGRGDQE